MKKRTLNIAICLLTVLFIALLNACGGPPASQATPVPSEEGKALFTATGCGSCHGANAQGIAGLGPALPGHSKEAVFRQVRSPPSKSMPAYDSKRLPDEELEKIVAFIQSLGPPEGAGEFAGSMTEAAHLRLALVAIGAGDIADAKAHLTDLIAAAEGELEEEAQEVLKLLEEGETHAAEHELEEILLQAQGSEWSEVQLHLVLALDALERDENDDAAAHIQDAISLASDAEQTRLKGLLADLKAGRAHDVEHELGEMVGLVE